MDRTILKLISLLTGALVVNLYLLNAQVYLHPTTGLNGTYAGACMVTDCGPATYYDNGGPASNYSNGINQVYRTFCPSVAGNCMSVTFTSFNTENGFDWLRIRNGSYQTAPIIATVQGTPATPFSYIANNSSGCLTFDFRSDGSVTRPGWAATLSCWPCAVQNSGTDTDCPSSTVICSSSPISTGSPGPGLISDGCGTCIEGGETFSNWFVFSPQTSGTIAMTIVPSLGGDDYDFAIWGPNATNCAALGAPIRCSYSAISGNTGMVNGAGDFTEGVGGNSWVEDLNVTAGEVYRLLITHWTPPSGNYTINWNLGGGATLDCTPPLPVELLAFNCQPSVDQIELQWSTASEFNNDYFILEKSTDAVNYTEVTRVQGKGNSNYVTEYIAVDLMPHFGTNYYRLTQVDINGESEVFDVIYCEYTGEGLANIINVSVFDLNGHLVYTGNENTNNLEQIVNSLPVKSGMYILYVTYDDGLTKMKKFVKI